VGEVAQTDEGYTVEANGQAIGSPGWWWRPAACPGPNWAPLTWGNRIARQFGHNIVEPAPALVGLVFPPGKWNASKDLSGIHLRVGAACGTWSLEEDLMITTRA